LGVGAGAAPGRRRAALGANFLPELLLLIKELNVAGACVLSAACAGCWVGGSSAMIAVCCSLQRFTAAAAAAPVRTWACPYLLVNKRRRRSSAPDAVLSRASPVSPVRPRPHFR
jgi:hypothetical protein